VQRDGFEVQATVEVHCCDDVLKGRDDSLHRGDALLLESKSLLRGAGVAGTWAGGVDGPSAAEVTPLCGAARVDDDAAFVAAAWLL
jgi:hypothetical protein